MIVILGILVTLFSHAAGSSLGEGAYVDPLSNRGKN